MPTYEYACRSCGEHLEIVQSFRDDALTTCPRCEGDLRKVFSAAGIIFKGSGWHSKDYASKSGSAASAGAGKDEGSSSEGGGESSGDSGSSSESSSSGASSDTGSSSTSGDSAESA